MTTQTDTPKLSKSEQSRINGAKSHGPTTTDGKKISSRNALKHGFAATENVVISLEDQPDWLVHRDGVRSSFHPQNYVELEFVDKLASISWRQSRLVAAETALIEGQISFQAADIKTHHPANADNPYFHLLLAWQGLANTPHKRPAAGEPTIHELNESPLDINSMELVRRYQVSLDRQYRNTLLNLRQYRKDFALAPAVPAVIPEVQPIPEPKPEPPPAPTEVAQPIEPQRRPTASSTLNLDKPVTPEVQPKTGVEPSATKLPRAA